MGTKCKIATYMLGDKRVGRIEGLQTLDNDATIQEAIDYGYVVGKKEAIKLIVAGVLKAMADGVKKDGDGRKIDGYLSVNAWPKCYLEDLTDDLNRSNAKVVMRARMLKEFRLDTAGWSFIVEGAMGNLEVTVVTSGDKVGEIILGEDVHLNGKGLAMGEGDSITWAVPDTGASGAVDAQHIESDDTRITIAAAADLAVAANDGKDVVFTVTVGNRKAVKSAVMRYMA